MAGLSSIAVGVPGQSTTTSISAQPASTTLPLTTATTHTPPTISGIGTTSTYNPYTFEIPYVTTVFNGSLPNLSCVHTTYPVPTDDSVYNEHGYESNAVGVSPVNNETWTQIQYCCQSKPIIIYEWKKDGCWAFCHANSSAAVPELEDCYMADPNHFLPGFDDLEATCDNCTDTSSTFSHTPAKATSTASQTTGAATTSTSAAPAATSTTPTGGAGQLRLTSAMVMCLVAAVLLC